MRTQPFKGFIPFLETKGKKQATIRARSYTNVVYPAEQVLFFHVFLASTKRVWNARHACVPHRACLALHARSALAFARLKNAKK